MNSKAILPSGSLDVQRFIDEQRFSPFQWLILLLCFLIVAADGFDTAAIGFVAPAVSKEWGVSKLALAPLLSAALFGLALGALAAGPLADRLGRKRVLLVSVAAFGICSLACGYSDSLGNLTLWRFLSGIGLGAAFPSAITLLSEYLPARRRGFLLGLMYCGFTLGAAGGGFVAAAVIPAFGWRAVFIIGGALPLLLAAFLLALPESIRFMVIRQWPADKIKAVLQRIAGVATIEATRFTLPDDSSGVRTSPLAVILGPRYRTGTLMLWVSYFMANLVLYLVTSWMPTLLKELGMSTQQASMLTALFPLGGALGALVCGYLLDKLNPHRVTGAVFFLAGVLICALGQTGSAYASVLTFGAGFFTGGGFFALSVLAAAYYPTHGRASGVAWMQGMGRFGGILGAVAGGALLQMGLDFAAILGVLAVPPLIASAGVLYKHACHRKLHMAAQLSMG